MLRFAETVISWYLRIGSSTNVEATGIFFSFLFFFWEPSSSKDARWQDGNGKECVV